MTLRKFVAACLLMTPLISNAEGFFRAHLEAVDLGTWPEISVLIRLEDEGSESGLDDGSALPNPGSKIDCPAQACWRVTRLEENGIPATLQAQQTAPIMPRSAEQFLWLRYRSNRPQQGDVELQLELETAYGGNRSASDQAELDPTEVTDTDLIRRSPWPYLAKHWDLELNLLYRTLRENVPKNSLPALTQAQRAWIRYRDAFCALPTEAEGEDAQPRCLALRSMARSSELLSARQLLDRPR